MVIAGERADDRREAHSRWAERYAKAGKVRKALAHFGRALDFGAGAVFANEALGGFQYAFEFVTKAVVKARDSKGLVGGSNLTIEHSKRDFKCSIVMTVRWKGVLFGSSERTAEASVFEGPTSRGLEHWLLAIGQALDECANKLDLPHETRVALQGPVMQNAFNYYIEHVRDHAERYELQRESSESSEQGVRKGRRKCDEEYEVNLDRGATAALGARDPKLEEYRTMQTKYTIFHVEWADGSGTARVFRDPVPIVPRDEAAESEEKRLYEELRSGRRGAVKLGKVVPVNSSLTRIPRAQLATR
jgi:hypothetical protein